MIVIPRGLRKGTVPISQVCACLHILPSRLPGNRMDSCTRLGVLGLIISLLSRVAGHAGHDRPSSPSLSLLLAIRQRRHRWCRELWGTLNFLVCIMCQLNLSYSLQGPCMQACTYTGTWTERGKDKERARYQLDGKLHRIDCRMIREQPTENEAINY